MGIIRRSALTIAGMLAVVSPADAQPLGTFRWQLQPYCNVLTVTVTPVAGVFRLEGTDDRCGAGERSSVIGTAFMNPDGSVGLGFNIVAAPGGQPQPVSARMALATLAGTWRDGQQSGVLAFTPGLGTGGTPRPLPAVSSPIPPGFGLQADGGFLAGGTFQSGSLPASGAGVRLMWSPAKAAIRAGRVQSTQWDDANIGSQSAAFNHDTRATGAFSLAVNDRTLASGEGSFAAGVLSQAGGAHSFAAGAGTVAAGVASVAVGQGTVASGTASFAGGTSSLAQGAYAVASGNNAQALGPQSSAFGLNTVAAGAQSLAAGSGSTASGSSSVALGDSAQAAGAESVALGVRVVASGNGSVVLGHDAVATGAAAGSFVFGDASTTTDIVSFAPNEFVARAAGGVRFYTNASHTSGVQLSAGGSSWSSLSDENMKENFREVDGEDILRKLARVPIREWSYKAQDPSIRHMGPTAQDFRAAFGLGDFPLRINTTDADGVALAALKALELRTRTLQAEQARLAHEREVARIAYEALAAERHDVDERLRRLERRSKRR
jgi:hypothetical protein